MIRFVVGPDGEAVPDLKRKLPGRGVWVTATRGALGEAIKRKVFARGFKRDVRLPAGSGEPHRRLLLERAALDALAIAGKAGPVVAGFAKVENALARDHGYSAAACRRSGARRGQKARCRTAPQRARSDAVVVTRILTSAQLDLALGRPNVIHAALLAGPSSDTFLARLRRLERFRTGDLGSNRPQAPAGAARPN